MNGLISDFMLAEHSSCCWDKGQVQDEVRGDALCQCAPPQTVSRPQASCRFFSGGDGAAPQRGVCWHFKLTENSWCVEFKEEKLLLKKNKKTRKSQSHSSAMLWLPTRSEICWTASYFSSHMFLIDTPGYQPCPFSYSYSPLLSPNGPSYV